MAARILQALTLLLVVTAGCDAGVVEPLDGAAERPDLLVTGCERDTDCTDVAAPYCDAPSHTCVSCQESYQCSQGFICSKAYGFGQCLESCNTPGDCTRGETGCCDHGCLDLQADRFNCGGCGVVCDGWFGCYGGKCGCSPATPDLCTRRCVNTRSDPGNCGGCGKICPVFPNAQPSCVDGACAFGSCAYGYADCDQQPANGCETNTYSGDPGNCGACGKSCAPGQTCMYMRCQ